jgi:hypothetical protein
MSAAVVGGKGSIAHRGISQKQVVEARGCVTEPPGPTLDQRVARKFARSCFSWSVKPTLNR